MYLNSPKHANGNNNYNSPTHYYQNQNPYFNVNVPKSYHNLYSPKHLPHSNSKSSLAMKTKQIKESKIIDERYTKNYMHSPKETIQILSPSRAYQQNLSKVVSVQGRKFYFNSPTSYKNSRECSKQTKVMKSPHQRHYQSRQNIYYRNSQMQNCETVDQNQTQEIQKYKILIQEYQTQNNKLEDENAQIMNKIKQKKKIQKAIIQRIELLKSRVDQMKKIKEYNYKMEKQTQFKQNENLTMNNKNNSKQQTLEDQFYESFGNNKYQNTLVSDHIQESLDDSGFPSQLLPPSSNQHFSDQIFQQKQPTSLQALQRQFNQFLKMSRIQINQKKKEEMRKKMANLADLMKKIREL